MMAETIVLKSLLQESKDGEWGKGEPFADSVEMAVIRGTDFESARVGDIEDLPIRHIPAHIANRKTLRPNDLLIETAGGSGNRPTGRTLFVTQSLVQKSRLPLTCASFSRFIRVDPLKADPNYVFWMLQHLFGSGIMWKYSTRHTGVARFQYTVFSETEKFDLPPLPTQRRIASILSAYDDLIENNTRRIKILEQMAQAIYREWFVEFRAPGVKLRKATPEEQKVTGKDRFPVGWKLKQLGEIAQEVRRGVQPDQIDPETPYFGLEHLPRKSIALSEWGTARQVQSTKLAFKKGEILFGKIRPYFHKVGVAPVDGVCSTDTLVIVPKSAEYFALTLACVSSEDFVTQATQTSQGTKMPRANWDVLTKYPVPIPPQPLLEQFNSLLQDSVDLIINMVYRNRNLRQTRDLLLPRLVGEEIIVET
jgi:type I restriction enzyme, S subunit